MCVCVRVCVCEGEDNDGGGGGGIDMTFADLLTYIYIHKYTHACTDLLRDALVQEDPS